MFEPTRKGIGPGVAVEYGFACRVGSVLLPSPARAPAPSAAAIAPVVAAT